jgi:hypothetical protein
MGLGCESVRGSSTATTESITGVCNDGRVGTYRAVSWAVAQPDRLDVLEYKRPTAAPLLPILICFRGVVGSPSRSATMG